MKNLLLISLLAVFALSGCTCHTVEPGNQGVKVTWGKWVIDRNTPQIRLWKKKIFGRDNYTCVLCGERGGYLIADHYPYPFYKYPEHRTDLKNGRTLCTDCNFKKTYEEREWAYA